MTTQNWPDPKRPGVPMFPERDGVHTFQVSDLEETDIIYYWHQNGGGWTEYNHQGSEDFLTDEDMQGWIYKGPVLTPTQINEMLAAERERAATAIDHLKNEERGLYATGLMTTRAEITIRALAFAAEEIRNLGAAP